MPHPPRFKICGLTDPLDARAAEEAGASYVGAVLAEESPRRISPTEASRISEAVSIPLVLVTVDLEPARAAAAATIAGADGIQLHGHESPAAVEELRGRGEWELWKAVRVRSGDDVRRAVERFGSIVDLLLLDAWHPRKLGGTGVALQWEDLASARDEAPREGRLGVAGGLSPENVARAIAILRPDLVDVSSGVEASPGVKDHDRIRRFAREVARSGAAVSDGDAE